MFNKLQHGFYKVKFWGIKNSPTILTFIGVTAMVGSVASAVYSTIKLKKTISPYNDKICKIREDLKDDNKIQNKIVDPKELKKDLGLTYLKCGLAVTRLYVPTLILLGTAVSCTVSSHNILKNRNIALAATYATLERSYDAYRQRVKNKLGEEVEEKLFNNVSKEKVTVIDPETGKEKQITQDVEHPDKEQKPWKVTYACPCTCWEPNALLNFEFLMLQQDYLNEKLRTQGYLFLKDVYDVLGIGVSHVGAKAFQAARYYGWVYDPKDPTKDNYVTFGITYPGTRQALPRVQNQIDHNFPDFFLDINVEGDILSGDYGRPMFANYAREGKW